MIQLKGMRKASSLIIVFALAIGSVFGQASNTKSGEKERFTANNKSGECSIKGTSTLHDWESTIEDFSISATKDGDLIAADFTVVVGSIKSGHNGMDKNTYKALREDQHPKITFSASNLKISGEGLIKGQGDLTIAGQTKRIPVVFSMASWLEDTMTIVGEITINMTDYGVDPPVALLGTIKTGEEIVFAVNTTLNKVNN
jgi:polyisoprenoid-binding protein YceI